MILYHKTNVDNVDSILKHGLLVCKGRYNRIYLCYYPDMDMGLGHALFQVDIPDGDPNLNVIEEKEIWEFHSYLDLPSEWITYLGEFGPNKKPE